MHFDFGGAPFLNCRHTRHLISACLDQELTGREMLDLQAHLHGCATCAQEWREISEVRRLLRALPFYAPPVGAEQRLAARLARPDDSLWSVLSASMTSDAAASMARPRGRRLAAALALSWLVILAIAAPGPPPLGDAAALNAGAITTLPPVRDSLLPLTANAWVGSLLPGIHLASAASTTPQEPAQAPSTEYSVGDAEPLRDQAAVDYVQGNVALADYRTSAQDAR